MACRGFVCAEPFSRPRQRAGPRVHLPMTVGETFIDELTAERLDCFVLVLTLAALHRGAECDAV